MSRFWAVLLHPQSDHRLLQTLPSSSPHSLTLLSLLLITCQIDGSPFPTRGLVILVAIVFRLNIKHYKSLFFDLLSPEGISSNSLKAEDS